MKRKEFRSTNGTPGAFEKRKMGLPAFVDLKKHFRLKQIVKKPTRKDAILDLILTNLHEFYDDPRHFPPFGLSDHNTIAAQPRTRVSSRSTKYVFKRDMRAIRKAEMGRFFSSMDRPSLFTC